MVDVVGSVAALLPVAAGRPVLVAVDGGDGAGKTTFADSLGRAVEELGRPSRRVSLDDFHRVRAERYARGRSSAEGFWLDSFDYDRFRSYVLAPLAEDGDRRVRSRGHDLGSDAVLDPEPVAAPADAVVIVDGLFLQRSELDGDFDVTVFLRASEESRFARMAARDGGDPDPAADGNLRYRDAHRIYLAERDPESRADVVVDTTDVAHPVLVRPTAQGW